jgi:predicted MFS family arabinose efflux permease
MKQPQNVLFTRNFLALNVILTASYINVAVFFNFHEYLQTLPIKPEMFGLVIGIFSLAVAVIRPIIAPLIHPQHAKFWIIVGCVGVAAGLAAYSLADSLSSMLAVRIVHGAAYVLLAVAALNLITACIPPNMSGRAFGFIAALSLVPYAVIPPFMDGIVRFAGGYVQTLVLTGSTMLMAVIPALMLENPEPPAHGAEKKPGFGESFRNAAEPRILALLALSFTVWAAFAPVFFFLKEYGDGLGIERPGQFFTVSVATEILVRVVAGRYFDSLSKPKLLAGSCVALGIGFSLLAGGPNTIVFYFTAVLLGLAWGVALPLLSGLMFDISEPRFRAVNSNLAMEMFQLGFFVGPAAGGIALSAWGYGALYYLCAALMFLSAPIALLAHGRRERTAHEGAQ